MKILIFLILIISCSPSDNHEHEAKQLYTCSMHPNIIREEPGSCPQCGMDLTPIKQSMETASETENKILYYRAPMDANEIYDKPGKSKMGMDLIPVYEKDVEGVTVRISPALEQNIGLRTAKVRTKKFLHKISAVASITYDETRINSFSSKFSGWVERLYIDKIGQAVRKGEALYQIYSPEVVSAQEEYVSAIKMSKLLGESGEELIKSAKKRLEYWDIPEKQIAALKESLVVQRTVTIPSPYTGFLTERLISNGDYLQKGKQVLQITDFSKLWAIAEFYDKDSPFIAVNDDVIVRVNGNPKEIKGKIDYIYPEIDAKTRTIKARVVLPNPNNDLKVNMFAKLELRKEAPTASCKSQVKP